MGFDGVLITDYGAILEMIAHGYAEAEKDAAHKAVEAGADIDMMTSAYAANLKRLVEEKKIDEALIDEAAFRILELKNKLGLFENPYKDADAKAQGQVRLCSEHRALAREAAQKTCVLLKNDGHTAAGHVKENRLLSGHTPIIMKFTAHGHLQEMLKNV